MKELFFKGVVVAVPIVLIAGLAYMIYHGISTLYHDMQLKKELDQIARESRNRRQGRDQHPPSPPASDRTAPSDRPSD